MLKLYIGGSPCTHWSIAQTKNRETEASGIGWELFQNYVIGLRKYKPDYFLYENNKSMAPAIREQITKELGVEPILINSALVSAQNRQRLYWSNIPGITQPQDKGILLRDILETGTAWREKSYTLDANYYRTADTYDPSSQHSYSRHMAAEPVGITNDGKAHVYTTKCQFAIPEDTITKKRHSMVAEPVQVLNINPSGNGMNGVVMQVNGKSRTLTTNKGEGSKIIEPVRIGTIENEAKNNDFDSQQYRVYSPEGKAVTLCGNGGGIGAKTGLYAVPCAARQVGRRVGEDGKRHDYDENIEHFQRIEVNENPNKTNCLTSVQKDNLVVEGWDGKTYPVYEVLNGLITIKDKQYPIKLPDGFYIIRKLTVKECMRLQTVPDTYTFPVSDSQAYKMLGNGWTVDVIAHQLSFIPGIYTEEIEVLSMYDGMSCGHIALDKLGANVIRYYATEIDKYAIQTTKHNYPNTIHLGDAYQVRNDDFILTTKEGKSYESSGLIGQMTIDEWVANF
jgi:DNA (cytosine-5)-methyltransferase 3A